MKEVNDSGELTRLLLRPKVSITLVIRIGILQITYLGLSSLGNRGVTERDMYGMVRNVTSNLTASTRPYGCLALLSIPIWTQQE